MPTDRFSMNEVPASLLDFFAAYVECALWSSTDDNGESMDALYTLEDIDADGLREMLADCDGFAEGSADDLEDWGDAQAGHDFWLTRNGHGAGFWDRGRGERGDRLTRDAHAYGSQDLYIGDDGRVYVS